MKSNTLETTGREGGWILKFAEAVRGIQERGDALSAQNVTVEVTRAIGCGAKIAQAVLAASDAMAEYAMGAYGEDEDSLAEEENAIAASRRAFRPLLEARLQARIDGIDEAMKGRVLCLECDATAQSCGRPAREWDSALGPLSLKRRFSQCTNSEHKRGRFASQEKLLLPEGPYTASLEEAITLMATTVPHGMAKQLLGQLMGVDISEHAVQDAVERRGRGVIALDGGEAEELRPFDDKGFEREVPRLSDAVTEAPTVAYMEIDGVIPMTRELDETRSAPVEGARGGKGRRYTLVGREVKNAVLYTDADCAEESEGRGCILNKRYVSHLGNWNDFSLTLWVAMRKLRFDEGGRLVILSDGAEWIRSLAESLPVNAFLILDLYHALHRVWEVGRAVYGEHTPECEAWSREQSRRIEAGCVNEVIESLRFLLLKAARGTDKVEALITYFTNNRSRMDYPSYRTQGLRITSGTVESANYHVTGARLKLQGMRWSEAGAAEMAKLRADLFNNRWRERTRQLLAA
jgi:hypothetical protein